MRVLIVEDELKIAEALKRGLESEGYEAVTVATGEEGFYSLSTEPFDLMLLDLMLPGRDGLDVLKTARAKGHTLPVLVLTGRDTVEDRVLGLDSGADDYLIKPFAFPELLARIRLLLRRGRQGQQEPVSHQILADLELNLATHQDATGRSGTGSDPAGIRTAGISGAAAGTRGIPRNAGPRHLESTGTLHPSGQRDRRQHRPPAPQG